MFTPTTEGASAPTASFAPQTHYAASQTQYPPEPVRHILFGSLSAVRETIKHLHKLRYAEANDWSQPISTGRPNEVMAILTKRVRIAQTID